MEVSLSSENIPVDLENYRAKLLHLRKLNLIPKLSPQFSKIPIFFLIGSLSNNLTLLWDETMELFVGQAQLNYETFFNIFSSVIEEIESSGIFLKKSQFIDLFDGSDFFFFSSPNIS